MGVRKLKFFKKIGGKLFLVTLFSIVATVAATSTTQHIGSKGIVDQALYKNTQSAMNALHNKIKIMQDESLDLAKSMATDAEMIQAIEGNDADAARQTAINISLTERIAVEFITVADKQGTVLTRTHNDKAGDSIAPHRNIVGALSGKAASYIEMGTAVKLSVISSAPVRNAGGEIIGTVSMGYQLDNPAFADELKAMVGADISIFLGDERINTTIMKDNVRQIGTKLKPEVAAVVLDQQKSYDGITTVLDSPYYVIYEPIITDGNVVGILFAGVDITDVKQEEARVVVTVLSIVITLAAFLLLINILITRRMIVKPVLALSESARELAGGNLNLNLTPHPYDDEIGLLTESIRNVSQVLSGLISEMDNMAHDHEAGEIDAYINENRYEGAYKEVAAGTNEMTRGYIRHMLDLCAVLQSFGRGDFNAEYAILPGKKHKSNEVVEDLRENLRGVSHEIDTLAIAALEGRLSTRAASDRFQGDWKVLLAGLNAVMDAVIAPINEASEVLENMAGGRLNTRIQGAYAGDFDIVKHSVNNLQQAVSSYISEISQTLSEVSSHNLDVGIDRSYIGDFSIIRDSINNIIATFDRTLTDISASAEQVAVGAKHISDSSAGLSQGASEQASAVEELNAIIEQVAVQTNDNAKTANKVNVIARDARKQTEKESEMMEALLTAMEGINAASSNMQRSISVINDISFQTNLLALNASVEAARAGEHGKGFGVVAEEVRTLASRSKEAAAETESLIESARLKVAEGVQAAHKTASGLETIVGMITEVSQHIGEIADASMRQLENIKQISHGIEEVAQVTNTNTAISEESAASAEELSSQADLLHGAVSQFTLKRRK